MQNSSTVTIDLGTCFSFWINNGVTHRGTHESEKIPSSSKIATIKNGHFSCLVSWSSK